MTYVVFHEVALWSFIVESQDSQNQKLPDFAANEINPVIFGDVFSTYGSIVVRNLLDISLIDDIRLKAENAYALADKSSSTGKDLGKQFRDFGHLSATFAQTENGKPQILDLFSNSRIPPLYRSLLGERIKILVGNSLPRRQHPRRHNPPVPFHQDASFLGDPGLIINSWIPLNEAGLNAPGIEILLRPETKVHNQSKFKAKPPATYEDIDVTRSAFFSEIKPDLLWAPVMSPGDVLFFSHLTIHRTYQTDAMKLPRISLEIRCMSA